VIPKSTRRNTKVKKKGKKKDKGKKKAKDEKGPKSNRISLVQNYLAGTDDSIANYAVPAQLALSSVEGDPNPQHLSLAKAAASQFQAEECYRYYISALHLCSLKDKKCVNKLTSVQSKCSKFAEDAYNHLVDKTEL